MTARAPLREDAQRLVAMLNHLAMQMPTRLATVQVSDVEREATAGGGLMVEYTTIVRANGPAQRTVLRVAECAGEIRRDVLNTLPSSMVGYSGISLDFPVGVAFLNAQGRAVAVDLPQSISVQVVKGHTYGSEAGISVPGSATEGTRFSTTLPRDIASRVVRYVPVVTPGGSYLTRNGYSCEGSLCVSSTPLPLDRVEVSQSSLAGRLRSLVTLLVRNTAVFGVLNRSVSEGFCADESEQSGEEDDEG